MINKQIWKVFIILMLVIFVITILNKFENIIEGMTDDSFRIQYQVLGIENDPDKDAFLSTIKKAINKVEKIVTKSNKLNYTNNDANIPVKTINDLYVTVTLSDSNIKEESGALSKDTIGGSNIIETKTIGSNIFPVVATIQMLKKTASEDIKVTYDVTKYPHTSGFNRFYYVFLHELLHVMGVGFLWTDPEYEDKKDKASYNRYWIADPLVNPAYVGPSLAKYNGVSATVYYYSNHIGQMGKLKSVPIEDNGESGTRLWHWEQGDYRDNDNNVISQNNRVINGIKTPGLDNEIMVGWGTDKPPYLSTITIGNLEDLGYQVNYNEADSILPSNKSTQEVIVSDRSAPTLAIPTPKPTISKLTGISVGSTISESAQNNVSSKKPEVNENKIVLDRQTEESNNIYVSDKSKDEKPEVVNETYDQNVYIAIGAGSGLLCICVIIILIVLMS